jgi:hypothetical protein
MRRCKECEFRVESKQIGLPGAAEELAAMAPHLEIHNPSPAQWSTAYSRMRHSKDLGKPCGCEKCA